MDPTQISESDFLCDGNRETASASPTTFDAIAPILKNLRHKYLKDLGCGYKLHEIVGRSGDILLLHEGEIVGCYLDELLAIHNDHRGRELSTPLILAAITERPLPKKRIVSREGERALRKAWNVANGKRASRWPLK